jgi:hypothetical protein
MLLLLLLLVLTLVEGVVEEEPPKNKSSCSSHVLPVLFRSLEDGFLLLEEDDHDWYCWCRRMIICSQVLDGNVRRWKMKDEK